MSPVVPLPRALLLPGMMCDAQLFSAQRPALDKFDPIDLDPGVEESIEALGERALALTDGGPVILVGLSMGGIIAMECLRQAPERIAALILMDTNHLAEADERRALRIPQIERALSGELDVVLIEEMKPLYLAPQNRGDEALLQLVLDMARALGPEVFAAQSRAVAARRDYSDTLAAWQGPTLLICGEHDALCPPERHRAMQWLMPQAELALVANAGHLPTLEAAEATTRLIDEFIARVFP